MKTNNFKYDKKYLRLNKNDILEYYIYNPNGENITNYDKINIQNYKNTDKINKEIEKIHLKYWNMSVEERQKINKDLKTILNKLGITKIKINYDY